MVTIKRSLNKIIKSKIKIIKCKHKKRKFI